MIVCITTTDRDTHGRPRLVVSHGIDTKTDKVVILSSDPPETIGAVWDNDMGEWVIRDKKTDDEDAPRP